MNPTQVAFYGLALTELIDAHVKQANSMIPSNYAGMSVQQYLPTNPRRSEFSPEEEREIEKGKQQWIGRIFQSDADSPAVDMASPTKSALLAALLGALGGGVVGSTLGDGGNAAGATIGATLGAGLGGAAGYFGRVATNKSIEEQMRRIPENGTRRDVLSDPVVQARLAMQMQAQQPVGRAGLIGALLANN